MLTVSTYCRYQLGRQHQRKSCLSQIYFGDFPIIPCFVSGCQLPPQWENLKEVAGVYSCQHQTYSHFYVKLWRIGEVSDEVRNWLNIVQRCYFQASTWRSRVVKQGGQHQIYNVWIGLLLSILFQLWIGLLLLILLQVLMQRCKRLLYLAAATAVNVRWSLSSNQVQLFFASRPSLLF